MSSFADRAAAIQYLEEARIIGLVRTGDPGEAVALGRALFAAGLKAIEVSFTTPGAQVAIAELVADRAGMVGAGTVSQPQQAVAALAAGARFLIAPHQPRHLVSHAHDGGAVAILGGLTPGEIASAREAGADFVKVFPVRALGGPTYLRDLRGPFPDLPILVSGGVDASNCGAYLEAGASLAVLGSGLVPAELLRARDWEGVAAHVRAALAVAGGRPQSPATSL